MLVFWCDLRIEAIDLAIERSVLKPRAGIIMNREVMYINIYIYIYVSSR